MLRHDGVERGWRQPHDGPISGGDDRTDAGGGVQANSKQSTTEGAQGGAEGLDDKMLSIQMFVM